MSTFAEIAARARDMVPIRDPASGGQSGYRRDMQLLAELAEAMDRFERKLDAHRHSYLATTTSSMAGISSYESRTGPPLIRESDDG